MTTFGTFDIDGLPAPSDFELAAADRANAAHGRCTDAECSDATVDPQDWTEFDRAVLAACDEGWTREALLQARDARDLRDTCADALI